MAAIRLNLKSSSETAETWTIHPATRPDDNMVFVNAFSSMDRALPAHEMAGS
jgi:hypothetical protein